MFDIQADLDLIISGVVLNVLRPGTTFGVWARVGSLGDGFGQPLTDPMQWWQLHNSPSGVLISGIGQQLLTLDNPYIMRGGANASLYVSALNAAGTGAVFSWSRDPDANVTDLAAAHPQGWLTATVGYAKVYDPTFSGDAYTGLTWNGGIAFSAAACSPPPPSPPPTPPPSPRPPFPPVGLQCGGLALDATPKTPTPLVASTYAGYTFDLNASMEVTLTSFTLQATSVGFNYRIYFQGSMPIANEPVFLGSARDPGAPLTAAAWTQLAAGEATSTGALVVSLNVALPPGVIGAFYIAVTSPGPAPMTGYFIGGAGASKPIGNVVSLTQGPAVGSFSNNGAGWPTGMYNVSTFPALKIAYTSLAACVPPPSPPPPSPPPSPPPNPPPTPPPPTPTPPSPPNPPPSPYPPMPPPGSVQPPPPSPPPPTRPPRPPPRPPRSPPPAPPIPPGPPPPPPPPPPPSPPPSPSPPPASNLPWACDIIFLGSQLMSDRSCALCSVPFQEALGNWPPPSPESPPPPSPSPPPPLRSPPPSPPPPSPPPPFVFAESAAIQLLLSGSDAQALNGTGPQAALQAALYTVAAAAVLQTDNGRTAPPTLVVQGVTFPVRVVAAAGGMSQSTWTSLEAQRSFAAQIAAQFGVVPAAVRVTNASWPLRPLPPPPPAPPPAPPGPPGGAGRRLLQSSVPGSAPAMCSPTTNSSAFQASITIAPPNVTLTQANTIVNTVNAVSPITAQTLLPSLQQAANLPLTCLSLGPPEVLALVTVVVTIPMVIANNPVAPKARMEAVISAMYSGIFAAAADASIGAATGGLSLEAETLTYTPNIIVYAPPPLSPPPSPPPSPPTPPSPPAPPVAPSGPGSPPGPPPAPATTFAQQFMYGEEGAIAQVIYVAIIGGAVGFVLCCTCLGCTLKKMFGAKWAKERAERVEAKAALKACQEAAEAAELEARNKIPDIMVDAGTRRASRAASRAASSRGHSSRRAASVKSEEEGDSGESVADSARSAHTGRSRRSRRRDEDGGEGDAPRRERSGRSKSRRSGRSRREDAV
jgi:hypothetical protein